VSPFNLTPYLAGAIVRPNRKKANLGECYMADDITAEQWWSAILTGDGLNVTAC
jgi:hypothetical protein